MRETLLTILPFMILKQTRLEKPQEYVNFQRLSNQVCTVSTTIYCLRGMQRFMLQGKWFVTLTKSLENFLTYLEKTVRCVKRSNNIYTVSIGHNSQVFDTPTLLRQTGHQLWEKISCRNVFFSDTLPVMKNLVKRKHPFWSYRMVPQLN